MEKKKIPFQPPTKEEVEAYFDRLLPMGRINLTTGETKIVHQKEK